MVRSSTILRQAINAMVCRRAYQSELVQESCHECERRSIYNAEDFCGFEARRRMSRNVIHAHLSPRMRVPDTTRRPLKKKTIGHCKGVSGTPMDSAIPQIFSTHRCYSVFDLLISKSPPHIIAILLCHTVSRTSSHTTLFFIVSVNPFKFNALSFSVPV